MKKPLKLVYKPFFPMWCCGKASSNRNLTCRRLCWILKLVTLLRRMHFPNCKSLMSRFQPLAKTTNMWNWMLVLLFVSSVGLFERLESKNPLLLNCSERDTVAGWQNSFGDCPYFPGHISWEDNPLQHWIKNSTAISYRKKSVELGQLLHWNKNLEGFEKGEWAKQ